MTDNTHTVQTDDAAHDHSHGGLGKYIAVTVGLMLLTITSFAIANSAIMETPAAGWAIMMAVSTAKALLVIAFFMHLIWEANWKYVLTIPASIMSLFLVLMLVPDIGFRTRHYSEDRQEAAAQRLLYTRPAGHGEQHGPPLPYTVKDLEHLEEHLKSGSTHGDDHDGKDAGH